MSNTSISRRALLRTAAFGAAGASLGLKPWRAARAADLTVGIVYVGARDDFGWNQAHAVAIQVAEGSAGRQSRRGGERAGDRRRLQVDGIDDQPRRRRPDPRHLVRLLQAVRRRSREEISRRAVPPRRAAVEQGHRPEERRLLFRLSQPGRITSTASRRASRPRPTRSASSPPSRSPACSPTSTRCCSARAASIRRRRCR